MEDFITLLLNNGGTVVLAVLFIYLFLADRADIKEEKANNTNVLKELATSNKNIAESLSLLKVSINNNTAEYKQHDERAIKEFAYINEHLVRIEDKIDKRGE